MSFDHTTLTVVASILIALGINTTNATNQLFIHPGAQQVLSIANIDANHASENLSSYRAPQTISSNTSIYNLLNNAHTGIGNLTKIINDSNINNNHNRSLLIKKIDILENILYPIAKFRDKVMHNNNDQISTRITLNLSLLAESIESGDKDNFNSAINDLRDILQTIQQNINNLDITAVPATDYHFQQSVPNNSHNNNIAQHHSNYDLPN